jgi:adenylate kinase family enzyme
MVALYVISHSKKINGKCHIPIKGIIHMKQTLILVTGSPATGKTTLATQLSERLNIPVFYRDRITEVLWDAPAPGDKVPNQFGPASAEVIFHIIEQLMKSRNSFIKINRGVIVCNFTGRVPSPG